MMNDLTELKDGWDKPHPPSRTAHLSARDALLHRIAGTGARQPRRGRGIRLGWPVGTAVTAALAAILALTVMVGAPTQPGQSGQSPGRQAGPTHGQPGQPSGPEILLNAAMVAQAKPAATTGAYWHVKQEAPLQGGPKRTQTLHSWITRDGSRYGMTDGDPGATQFDSSIGFSVGGSLMTLDQLDRLPTDPQAIKEWLANSYGNLPADQGIPAADMPNVVVGALIRMLWEIPAAPAVRAGVLRALATMPNVANLGAMDGGQGLRIGYGQPSAEKYPGGKVPAGAGQETLVIDPAASTLLSSTNAEGTTRILEAGWTDEMPKMVTPPQR